MMTMWKCATCGATTMPSMSGGKCEQCNILEMPESERHTCPACGKWVRNAHREALCFYCQYWEDQIAEGNNIVVNGVHYRVDFERPWRSNVPSSSLGMGGSAYTIQMADGRKIRTNNLWYQGRIPELFRNRLPDNAEFVT